jgi:hypothetical protein
MVYRLSFLPRALLATSLSCGSVPDFFFRGDYSPTATSAPSLRPARPERFPDTFLLVQVIAIIQIIFFLSLSHTHTLSLSPTTVGAVTHGVADAPTYPALTSCTISFSVSEGAYLFTRSISLFPVTRWTSRLLALRTPVRKPSCRIRLLSCRSLGLPHTCNF